MFATCSNTVKLLAVSNGYGYCFVQHQLGPALDAWAELCCPLSLLCRQRMLSSQPPQEIHRICSDLPPKSSEAIEGSHEMMGNQRKSDDSEMDSEMDPELSDPSGPSGPELPTCPGVKRARRRFRPRPVKPLTLKRTAEKMKTYEKHVKTCEKHVIYKTRSNTLHCRLVFVAMVNLLFDLTILDTLQIGRSFL